MRTMLLRFMAVAIAVAVVQTAAYGVDASGTAQLGHDPRLPANGQTIRGDFGFAFMDNVAPVPSGATDTCTTLDNQGNHTLKATDGVASPENAEPIRVSNVSADTMEFVGRTGDCYYMVSGPYGGGGGDGGGGDPPKWNSDFDTNSNELSSPHFVVTINDRYRSDDDCFITDNTSTVTIELHNQLNVSGSRYFKLLQIPLEENGAVTLDPNQIYSITPGTSVSVSAMALSKGVVSIIARETDAFGNPPTAGPAIKQASASANVKPFMNANLAGN